MTDAYKVGVTFALKNLVSAELVKIAEQMALVDKAALGLADSLKRIGMGGPALAGVAEGMEGITTASTAAAASVERLAATIGTTGAAGSKFSLMGALTSIKGMAVEYGLYKALKGGMSMEDTIARSMIAAGVHVGPDYMDTPFASVMQKSIANSSIPFGVPLGDTQEAALQAMRALAPLSVEQRMRLMPSLLNFAGAEVLGKHGTTMLEATEAGIGLAHQLRAYSPEQIEPLLGAFAKLSMASPQSLSQLGRAGSYYLPLLTAGLGMDPTELMAIGAVGSQMGLSTKSGTWIANMFQSPYTSDLTSKRMKARREALSELGLFKDGHMVTRDAFEFLNILASHAAQMPPDQRTHDFYAAFGMQGMRGAAIFTDPAVMKNIMALAEGLKSAQTPEQLRQQYQNSPTVRAGQAMAEFNYALTRLGEYLLPVATTAMMGLVGAIQFFDQKWQSLKSWFFPGGSTQTASSVTAPPARGEVVSIVNKTFLDSKLVAQSTADHFVNGMSRGSSGSNSHDVRSTGLMPGVFSPAMSW